MDNIVEISELKKYYGDFEALKSINLTIKRGELFGLLGPNGAGKTTTVEIIAGLRNYDGGKVSVLSYNPNNDRRKLLGKVALQPQSMDFLDRLKVKEILNGFSSFYENPKDVMYVLEQAGLVDKSHAYFKDLSGGQKQRLNFAIALLSNAELIILDEPTTGLDPQGRSNLHNIIRKLKTEGKTIILTTHYIEEAQKLCDRVSIIDEGKIIADGEPKKLIESFSKKTRIELSGQLDDDFFIDIPEIVSRLKEDNNFTLWSANSSRTLETIFKKASINNVKINRVNLYDPTLEDVYLELTGRKYRD